MLNLGQNLYFWRFEKGLTQNQLAQASGVSRPNLSAIEHGGRDVTVATLTRLAEELGTTPGTLVDGIPPPGYQSRRLNRYDFDKIARFSHGQKVSLNKKNKEIAEWFTLLVRNKKLALLEKKSATLPRTARQEQEALLKLKVVIGQDQLNNLVRRFEKIYG